MLRKGGWLWIAEVRSRFAGTTADAAKTAMPSGKDETSAAGEKFKMDKHEETRI